MARSFDSASSQRLDVTFTPPTRPFTMSVWFRPTVSTNETFFGFGRLTSTSYKTVFDFNSFGQIRLLDSHNIDASVLIAGAADLLDDWHLAVCVITSNAQRSLSIDGEVPTVNNTALVLGSMSGFRIGASHGSTPNYIDGDIAHPAIWACALNAAEIAELYNGGLGMDPRYIRPANLVAYWPLINNDLDVVGTYDLTAYNDPTFVSGQGVLTPQLRGANKGAVQKHPDDVVHVII